MIAHAPDADVKHKGSSDCGCGCGCDDKCRCESRCCDLECLVRPRFYCGQLLTDADLQTMVDWSRNRFSLSRYRHGWGVVCGLDVTCSCGSARDCCGDRKKGPTVCINPGYAIDCCGNDLVVCEPCVVDLGDICGPLDDPCVDFRPKAKPVEAKPVDLKGSVAARAAARGSKKDLRDVLAPDDCWASLAQDIVAVDLSLRYGEDLARGQRAMFRGKCSDVDVCEYSRVLERPCVHVELGDLQTDADDKRAEDWQKDFADRQRQVLSDITAAARRGPESLLSYLRRNPPHRFCFLEDLVCCLLPFKDKGRSQLQSRIVYFLYLDWLLHALECRCWSCRPDPGVPLARVLLNRIERDGETRCRVLYVDTSVPHRRPLRKDECRPVPRGAVDLAPYLWLPREVALSQLRATGIQTTGKPQVLEEADLLARITRDRLTWQPGDGAVQLWLVRDPVGVDRVTGFDWVTP